MISLKCTNANHNDTTNNNNSSSSNNNTNNNNNDSNNEHYHDNNHVLVVDAGRGHQGHEHAPDQEVPAVGEERRVDHLEIVYFICVRCSSCFYYCMLFVLSY